MRLQTTFSLFLLACPFCMEADDWNEFSIDGKTIEDTPVATFDQALQGRIPGVLIMGNSGEISFPSSFQIRGVNTFSGSTVPLFILDGMPISASDFYVIEVSDIEHITVLKSTAALARYGVRGANGVVLISTRSGRENDSFHVSMKSQYGLSNLAYAPQNMMNTSERLDFEEQVGMREAGQYDRAILEKTNINWQDLAYRNNAPFTQANVVLDGSKDLLRYYISGGYYTQQGVALGSDFSRINFRANIQADILSWLRLGLNATVSQQQYDQAYQFQHSLEAPISASLFMLPYWDPYNEDGSFATPDDGSWLGQASNPLQWVESHVNHQEKGKILSSFYAEVDIIKGLTLRGQGGLDYTHRNFGTEIDDVMNQNWQTTLAYSLSANESFDLSFQGGYEFMKSMLQPYDRRLWNEPYKFEPTPVLANPLKEWDALKSSTRLDSYFFSGDFSLLKKYTLFYSFRRDKRAFSEASSTESFFGSLGLRWDMKRELLLNEQAWLNHATWTLSGGVTGNELKDQKSHHSSVSPGPDYGRLISYVLPLTAHYYEKPERTKGFDLSLRTQLFDRIHLNMQYYGRYHRDLFLSVPRHGLTGVRFVWENTGAMHNTGSEIDIKVDLFQAKTFNWGVWANASYNKNKITQLYENKESMTVSDRFEIQQGAPYGSYILNRFAGVDPENGNALWLDKDGIQTNELKEEDRVLLEKSFIAPWHGGFGTDLFYRGFTISTAFSWVADRWAMNMDRYYTEANGSYPSINQSKELMNRWQVKGDVTHVPRYGQAMQYDTRLLENASYLRMEHLEVGYDFCATLLKKSKIIKQLHLFAQGQNLLTFSQFSGMDPEFNGNIYQATYPMTRQFSLGLQVSF